MFASAKTPCRSYCSLMREHFVQLRQTVHPVSPQKALPFFITRLRFVATLL